MVDTKTISMDASDLSWCEVEEDAVKMGFRNTSSYIQYCVEYFHHKRKWKELTVIKTLMFVTLLELTALLVLVSVMMGR